VTQCCVCVRCCSCTVRYLVGNKKDLNDPATHKWMLYVRGPQDEPRIDHFVDKVIFLLHDTYKPHNIVTVTYVAASSLLRLMLMDMLH